MTAGASNEKVVDVAVFLVWLAPLMFGQGTGLRAHNNGRDGGCSSPGRVEPPARKRRRTSRGDAVRPEEASGALWLRLEGLASIPPGLGRSAQIVAHFYHDAGGGQKGWPVPDTSIQFSDIYGFAATGTLPFTIPAGGTSVGWWAMIPYSSLVVQAGSWQTGIYGNPGYLPAQNSLVLTGSLRRRLRRDHGGTGRVHRDAIADVSRLNLSALQSSSMAICQTSWAREHAQHTKRARRLAGPCPETYRGKTGDDTGRRALSRRPAARCRADPCWWNRRTWRPCPRPRPAVS